MKPRAILFSFASCILVLGSGFLAGSALVVPAPQPTQEEIELEAKIAKIFKAASTDFSEGRYPAANEKYLELCKLSPDNLRLRMYVGESAFAEGDMKNSIEAFDEVIRRDPGAEPTLWQRGLALYYANRFEDGWKQFETHQTVNSQDVENAVWHLLCAARISDVETARKKFISISNDRRVPMMEIYEMFAGRMTPAEVLAKAQKETSRAPANSFAQQNQLYYAHLYTGLFHEMMGDNQAAMASMKQAVAICPMTKSNFMGNVSRVHVKLRERGQLPDKKPADD